MIDIALYKKNENEICNSLKKYNLLCFSHEKYKNCIHLNVPPKNTISAIKNHFNNKKFIFLFNDESLITNINSEIKYDKICLICDEFIIKQKRTYNIDEIGVEKILIKTNMENLYFFDDIWKKIKKDSDFIVSGFEFLFDKKFTEDQLFVYYKIIKTMLKNKKNYDQIQNITTRILNKYPNYIEIAILIGSFFYEQNNLYTALEFFEKAKQQTNNRHIYDNLPMIPKYHKTTLNLLIQNTKELINKYDQFR